MAAARFFQDGFEVDGPQQVDLWEKQMKQPEKKAPKVTWNERDQVWYIRYRLADGSRKAKNVPVEFQDKAAAQTWADSWYRAFLRNGRKAPTWEISCKSETKAPVTIRVLGDRWLAYREKHPKISRNTWKSYDSILRTRILKHAIADLPVDELTPQVLRAFITDVSKACAPNTTHNVATVVRTFFTDARAEKWIDLPSNPMRDEMIRDALPPQETQAGRGVIIHVEMAHLKTLLGCTSERIPPIRRVRHLVTVTTGMREGEVCGLIWSRAHLADEIPFLEIEQQLTSEKRIAPPKENSHRAIALHPQAILALKWWKDIGWKFWVGRDPTDADPIFPDTQGKFARPRTAECLRHDLDVAGCPTTYRGHLVDGHSLRRTFATCLNDLDIHPDDRKALMGHASVNVTDRHYTHRNLRRYAPKIALLDVPAFIEPMPGTWHGTMPSREKYRGIRDPQLLTKCFPSKTPAQLSSADSQKHGYRKQSEPVNTERKRTGLPENEVDHASSHARGNVPCQEFELNPIDPFHVAFIHAALMSIANVECLFKPQNEDEEERT